MLVKLEDNKRRIVIYNDVGIYLEALTRGKHSEVLAEDEEKKQIKVVGDNDRARWYGKYYFVPDVISAPVMVNWKFDDTIQDLSEKSLEHIEVTVNFSDGDKRWCSLCTKAGLLDYIERNMGDNLFLVVNQIIVKSFSKKKLIVY